MFFKENSIFPPINCFYEKFEEWGVWYSGEREFLINYYEKCTILPMTDNSIFWAKVELSERNNMIHIPVAGDIATMSSNLLFSESPRITYKNKGNDEETLKSILKENGFLNSILEGAEIAAAFGGVLLKCDIDLRLSKLPIISILTPLQFYPTFLRGRLFEVLMWREIKRENNGVVYRLFENRKRNGNNLIIEFKLYKGKNDNVGNEIELSGLEETANLNLENIYINNSNGLGVVYVPNMKPNKLAPGSSIGINDYNSSIPALDSLDAVWSSWMNDIELGRGQIFIDEELLKNKNSLDGTGTSIRSQDNSFSKFQRCFVNLNLSNYQMGGSNVKPIEVTQFEIRTDDHLKTCTELVKSIVGNCGYSPQTFGLDVDGRSESGTSLRIRERKSLLTREKKSRYWQPVISELMTQLLVFYNYANKKNLVVDRDDISVELEDSIIVDSRELSETIRNLDMAKAVSTYIKVKMQHNDWTEEEVEKEVERITTESGSDINLDNFDLNNYSKNNNNQSNLEIDSNESKSNNDMIQK